MESKLINPVLLLTPRETAELLSISPRKLWALTNSGEIPSVRIGGRSVRYRFVALEDYLKQLEQGGQR
jgi:excisionase family DNA binding protein